MEPPVLIPEVVRALFLYGSEHPVLYVRNGDDDSGVGDLAVDIWDAALVPHQQVVATRAEVEELVGTSPTAADVAEYLDVLQAKVDEVATGLILSRTPEGAAAAAVHNGLVNLFLRLGPPPGAVSGE